MELTFHRCFKRLLYRKFQDDGKKGLLIMARGRKKTTGSIQKGIKRANGTGSIYKLSGNRRKPWTVQLSSGTIKREDGSYVTKRVRLGYYATEEEAILALARYRENPYSIQDSYTFSEVYEMWSEKYFATLESDSSNRTIISAYNHVKGIWHRDFASLSIQDMRDAIEHPDNTPSIQSRIKSMLNLMYDFAVEAEIVEINKARQFSIKGLEKKIKKDRKDKIPISPAHVKALENDYEYGYTRMILIGIYTGFRPSEICQLHRCNIHLEENYIIGGMKTEAGEDRYVPIHPKIKGFIEYYYNRTTEQDKYLIKAEDGQRDTTMTYDKYRSRFKKSMSRVGAAELYSPHCTRYTFVTNAKEAKMDEYALKMIIGHEIGDVTEEVYTHRDESFLQEEILKIG